MWYMGPILAVHLLVTEFLLDPFSHCSNSERNWSAAAAAGFRV